MADLVVKVPDQCAVGFMKLNAKLLADGVVGLANVDRDFAAHMTGYTISVGPALRHSSPAGSASALKSKDNLGSTRVEGRPTRSNVYSSRRFAASSRATFRGGRRSTNREWFR